MFEKAKRIAHVIGVLRAHAWTVEATITEQERELQRLRRQVLHLERTTKQRLDELEANHGWLQADIQKVSTQSASSSCQHAWVSWGAQQKCMKCGLLATVATGTMIRLLKTLASFPLRPVQLWMELKALRRYYEIAESERPALPSANGDSWQTFEPRVRGWKTPRGH